MDRGLLVRLKPDTTEAAEPATFDVVVLGAGPAGAALAIDCLSRQLRVLVLEPSPYPRATPGETLHPGAETVLTHLRRDDRSGRGPRALGRRCHGTSRVAGPASASRGLSLFTPTCRRVRLCRGRRLVRPAPSQRGSRRLDVAGEGLGECRSLGQN